MDESDPHRDAIHAALQVNSPTHTERGALLVGWAVVTEWVDPDGERWLAKAHAATTSPWGAKGMYHEALNGDWPDVEDGD